MVQIYVDDIIFGGTSKHLVDAFVQDMTNEFEMSMVGELKYFLGLQIQPTKEGVFISQSTYGKALLKRFKLDHCKEARARMNCTNKIGKDEDGEPVDTKMYRGMIGSLVYLTASRPDLSLSVGDMHQISSKTKKISFGGNQANHSIRQRYGQSWDILLERVEWKSCWIL